MANCWSWEHDDIKPRYQLRQLQYSNWMLCDDWRDIASLSLPTASPYWRLNYRPSPAWTANFDWEQQLAAAQARGMVVNDAVHQLWFVNLAHATGIIESVDVYSRVIPLGGPLDVAFWRGGVGLRRDWRLRFRRPDLRAAVSGVDLGFGT